MPNAQITLQKKMDKYHIDMALYAEYETALTQIGYTQAQAEKLIPQPSHNDKIKTLLSQHDVLTGSDYGFSREQIIRMTCVDGGALNLKAVSAHFPEMKQLGFSIHQVVVIVSRHGGSHTLKSIKDNFAQLTNLKFTLEDICKLTKYNSASVVISAVLQHFETLTGPEYGYDINTIIKIAGRIGGRLNIDALIAHKERLTQLGFDNPMIIKLVCHDGGSNNIDAIINYCQALKDFEFSIEQIMKLAAQVGGSKNIQSIHKNFQALTDFGFNKEQMIKIGKNYGASKIKTLELTLATLKSLDFNASQLVSILGGRNDNSQVIIAMYDAVEAIKSIDFNSTQLTEILTLNNAAHKMKRLNINVKELKALEFNAAEVTQLLKVEHGSSIIDAIRAHYQFLINKGYDCATIVSIRKEEIAINDTLQMDVDEDKSCRFIRSLNNLPALLEISGSSWSFTAPESSTFFPLPKQSQGKRKPLAPLENGISEANIMKPNKISRSHSI